MEEDIWDLLLDGKPIAPLISENVVKVAPYLLNNEYSLQKLQWDQLEYELYNTKIRNTHPIIIVGFISTWPAFKKWESVDYLANIFGPKPILVLEAKDNLHFFKNVLTNHHEIPGDEAINLILNESKSSEKRWYARKSFKNRFLEDIFLPYRLVHKQWNEHENPSEIKSPFVKKNCTVWVSTKGNITPLHYDLCHGFLCQVSGIKKVTLFHKDDYRFLYPNETTHQNRTASKIDLKAFQAGDEVQQKLFPKFAEAVPYVHELHPGEIMYIPPFFWHHVESITESVSVLIPFDMVAEDPVHACCFYSG